MHILFVYCHPEPTSFTHALLEVAQEAAERHGHTSELSDLYAEDFNPVAGRHDFLTVADPSRFHYQTEQMHAAKRGSFAPEIQREQDRVRRADMTVFLFPLWWGGMPAMLKGWLDRVLAYGFAYVDGARFDQGLFRGRSAMMCISTGGTAERFSEDGTYGSIAQVLWPTTRCQLEYMGFDTPAPFVAYAAPRVGEDGRRRLIKEWRAAFEGQLTRHAARQPERTDLVVPEEVSNWSTL